MCLIMYMQRLLRQGRFDENVDLSTTYLGRIDMEQRGGAEGRRKLSYLRTRIC